MYGIVYIEVVRPVELPMRSKILRVAAGKSIDGLITPGATRDRP